MSYDWKKILIHSDSSIRQALKVINNEALRVALVIDQEFNLLGTVTDGDIRRGLLNNLSLEDDTSLVMNQSPITAKYNTSRAELVKIMEDKKILFIPLLRNNQVVGLELLNKSLYKQEYNNPVFIMAGGFGTRLRPLTDQCPKPMLKVGERPILEILIKNFIRAGFSNFYISTHYMPGLIRDYFGDGSDLGISINYVHEEEPLGTGGALGLLPENIPDLPLIMINGDVLTNVDFERLLSYHIENNADATMCVREYEYQVPYGVIKGKGRKIISMIEKPVQSFFVNAGVYVLSPKVIKSVPKNYHIDMPSLLETHLSESNNIFMFPIHEYWLDIGRMDDFERAQSDIDTIGFN